MLHVNILYIYQLEIMCNALKAGQEPARKKMKTDSTSVNTRAKFNSSCGGFFSRHATNTKADHCKLEVYG